MDKLELDARVARLERTVAYLWTVIGLGVAAGAAVGLLGFAVRGEATQSATVVTTPAPTPPIPVVTVNIPGMSLMELDREVRKAGDLKDHGLIDAEDFEVKKHQLLEQPIRQHDFKEDIERAAELREEGLLCPDEYAVLKKKLLGNGR